MVQKKSEMKFFFLAHGIISYNCLRDLIAKGYKPHCVVTHTDLDYDRLKDSFYEPITKLCVSNSIPVFNVNKISEIHPELAKCDVGMCLGFMEIIKKDTLDIPKHGIFNIHGGKLPKYRGRAPISRSIMNGEKFFTLTLHKMDEGVDSGDVCLETVIPITDKDDINTLSKRCAEETAPLIERFFETFKRETLDCRKQDLSQNPKAYRKISDEERKIDWNRSARDIFNLIRALIPPFPGAFFESGAKKFIALNSEILLDNEVGKPGEINFITEDSVIVKCGNGSINITSLADESLNPVSIINNFHKGDILE